MAYLKLPDDPPIPGEGIHAIDVNKYIGKSRLKILKDKMRGLPRSEFEKTINKILPRPGMEEKTAHETDARGKVHSYDYFAPSKGTQDALMFYANFLHLFNLVNAAEMRRRGITDPWKWEEEKMRAMYMTQAMKELGINYG